MYGEKPQKLIVSLVVSGTVLAIGAVVLFVIFTVMATNGDFPDNLVVVIPAMAFVAGLICFIAATISGWKNVGFKDSSRPIVIEPNCYIISCFILNKQGDTVFDPDMYDPDEIRYMAQIEFRNGDKHELQTTNDVFSTLGEGLVGKVHFQGRKLLKFERDPNAKHERKR